MTETILGVASEALSMQWEGTRELLVPPLLPPSHLLSSSSDGDGLGLLVAGFVFGLVLIVHGFLKWRRMRLIQDTPRERVRSIAIGRTELQGTAKPIDEPISRPFTGGDCVLATYEVEEYVSSGKHSHWKTLEEGVVGPGFLLDDGTGRIEVAPVEDGTYEISDRFRDRLEADDDERPPERVVESLRNETSVAPDLGTGWFSGSTRRYTQHYVPPGEEVYVLGGTHLRNDAVETGATNPDRLVLGRDEGSDSFILSDRPERKLVDFYGWKAPAEIVGGLALSTVTLFLLLAWIGI